jgi:hypothetical protein
MICSSGMLKYRASSVTPLAFEHDEFMIANSVLP